MNKEQAVRKWVDSFNAIPLPLIEKAYKDDYFEVVEELTPPTYECLECGAQYPEKTATELNYQCECRVPLGFADWCEEHPTLGCEKLDNEGVDILEAEYEFYVQDYYSPELVPNEFESFFPMWGTMWTFDDPCDNWWLENNLDKMADCGFRIYQSDEIGYFFGIDGAGYDFYEAHWTPLYEARGLQWHDNETGVE